MDEEGSETGRLAQTLLYCLDDWFASLCNHWRTKNPLHWILFPRHRRKMAGPERPKFAFFRGKKYRVEHVDDTELRGSDQCPSAQKTSKPS